MKYIYIADIQKVQEVLEKYLSENFVDNAISNLKATGAIRKVDTTESNIADKIIQSGLVLTDEEIETFKSYIDDDDMKIAFGNSDWVKIYHKITRFSPSDKAANLINKYNTNS